MLREPQLIEPCCWGKPSLALACTKLCGACPRMGINPRMGEWGERASLTLPDRKKRFRSVNVFLTTDHPGAREWGEDFTQVFVLTKTLGLDHSDLHTDVMHDGLNH